MPDKNAPARRYCKLNAAEKLLDAVLDLPRDLTPNQLRKAYLGELLNADARIRRLRGALVLTVSVLKDYRNRLGQLADFDREHVEPVLEHIRSITDTTAKKGDEACAS